MPIFFSFCFTGPSLHEPEAESEGLTSGVKQNMEGPEDTTAFFPTALEKQIRLELKVQGED